MNNIDKYIKFIKVSLTNCFKEIMDTYYKRNIFNDMLNTYIDIRYYNNLESKSSKIEKNIEYYLQLNLKEIVSKDSKTKEIVEKLYYFFWYLLYIDNTLECNMDELIEKINDDRKSILNLESDITKYLKSFIKEYNKKKETFNNSYTNDTFNLIINKTNLRKVYEVEINYNIKFPRIYSSYSINKVSKTDIINEDITIIKYNLVNKLILDDIINKVYDKEYIVDFSLSILSKKDKTNRLLNLVRNELVVKNIVIKFTNKEYLNNKDFIDELIKEGIKVALIIDETFDYDEKNIIWTNIFEYIITNKSNSEVFDKRNVIISESR